MTSAAVLAMMAALDMLVSRFENEAELGL